MNYFSRVLFLGVKNFRTMKLCNLSSKIVTIFHKFYPETDFYLQSPNLRDSRKQARQGWKYPRRVKVTP